MLREDGVTYRQYVTELTYLLFLKMMKEQKREVALPKGYRWDDLTALEGVEQLDAYKRLLLELGKANNRLVRDISFPAERLRELIERFKSKTKRPAKAHAAAASTSSG